MKPDETAFEAEIEAWLLDHGLREGRPSAFDRALGLDPGELLAFVAATQPDAWARLAPAPRRRGGGAQPGFLKRVAAELDERGTVDVLRHGVKDLGVDVRLAYFKPAHGLTPELVAGYEANRLTVVRQLRLRRLDERRSTWRCSSTAIPVATAELKNPLTGQTVEHAIAAVPRRPRPART